MINQYPPSTSVIATPSSTNLVWRKTMSGGETSFSGYDDANNVLVYTPGEEQVYLNGILLLRGTDYTATNGTSITNLSPLAASDIIQINAYNDFSVASFPTTSLTGTITNAQLANSSITINSTPVSLGGSISLATLGETTFTGAISGTDLTLSGNLTVNGTTTTINSTTLAVDDINITLGDVTSPTNITANGGGITLKGNTDKTFNWVSSTSSWTSSENLDLASTKSFKINGSDVLTSTQVLGKTMPSGSVVGTTDVQTLTNKTLTNPIFTQGTTTPVFSGNAYTLVSGDAGQMLLASNSSTAGNVYIPTNASVPFALGTQITVLQTGSGQLTISAATPGTTTVLSTGATAASPKCRVQYAAATLVKTATDTWYVFGDIA